MKYKILFFLSCLMISWGLYPSDAQQSVNTKNLQSGLEFVSTEEIMKKIMIKLSNLDTIFNDKMNDFEQRLTAIEAKVLARLENDQSRIEKK